MKAEYVITAFVDAHPLWKSVRGALTVTPGRDGWDYVVFQGSVIGRVKIEHRTIYAESFFSQS